MCTIMVVDNNQLTRNWVQDCIHQSNIKLNKIILCTTETEAEAYISSHSVDIAFARIDKANPAGVKLVKTIQNNLLFSIILGYGNCKDYHSLCHVFNNGVSQYLQDVFNKQELEGLLNSAYERYCSNRIKLQSMATKTSEESGKAYSDTFLTQLVESYLRNAKVNAAEMLESYINMLLDVMDSQPLHHSKTMVLEMLIIITEKVNDGMVKTDYVLFNAKDWQTIMSFKSAEDLKRMCANYLTNLAKNIYLLSNTKKQKTSSILSAMNFIKCNYHKDISRDDVAYAVSLNPCYFSKFFKEQLGESFVSYLRRIRMEKAKTLLESADVTITAVSEKVGYADSKYFSKLFVDYTGVTPGEYRKSIKKLLA